MTDKLTPLTPEELQQAAGMLVKADDERISWDTLGAELGEGEYHVQLYGPHEHTAWTPDLRLHRPKLAR